MNEKILLQELVNLTKRSYIAIGYQKLTVDGTVKTLTLPTDALYADIQLESSIATPAIRYKIDGGVVSATDGMFLLTGSQIDVSSRENLIHFQTTQVGAGTHTLHITYYK